MRRIDAYISIDGSIHHSDYDARQKDNQILGNQILALAKEICQLEKYTKAADWLNETNNMNKLRKLVQTVDAIEEDKHSSLNDDE